MTTKGSRGKNRQRKRHRGKYSTRITNGRLRDQDNHILTRNLSVTSPSGFWRKQQIRGLVNWKGRKVSQDAIKRMKEGDVGKTDPIISQPQLPLPRLLSSCTITVVW